MGYLIKNDFNAVIVSGDLDKLTASEDDVWVLAEGTAVEEMKSYLRNRYDVAVEFDYMEYLAASVYSEDDRVIVRTGDNQGHYTALQDIPANTAITDPAFWEKSDTRNKKLVNGAVIILLYENYTRLNGTEIPAWLQLRYDGGDVKQQGGIIGYLKNIQRGTIQPDIPLIPAVKDGTDQTGNRIAYGVSDNVIDRNKAI